MLCLLSNTGLKVNQAKANNKIQIREECGNSSKEIEKITTNKSWSDTYGIEILDLEK